AYGGGTAGVVRSAIEGTGRGERSECGAADGGGGNPLSLRLFCAAVSVSEIRYGADSRFCVWRDGACGRHFSARRVGAFSNCAYDDKPAESRCAGAARTDAPVVWRFHHHALV